jgi:kinetochore protein Nuf2
MSSFGSRNNGRGKPTPKRKKETFSFPLLEPCDIVACMSELGITLDEQTVKNPKAQRVEEVYMKLSECCMGITSEEMLQGKFEGLSALSYPELHEGSVPKMVFWRTVNKLMAAAQVPDFSYMDDLLKPSGDRFIRNLSAIINFAKFREERVQAYTEMTASTEQILEKKQQLMKEQEIMKEKIQALKEQHENEKDEADALKQENIALDEEISSYIARRNTLKYESDKLKEQSKLLQSKTQATKFKILGARDVCEQLQSQIISSPEKLKSELGDMQRQIIELRREIGGLSNSFKEKDSTLAAVSVYNKDMEKIIGLLGVVEDVVGEFKKQKKARVDLEKLVKENDAEVKELIEMEENAENQVSSLKEKLRKSQRDRKMKEAASEQCLAEAQLEYEELLKNRTVSGREKDILADEIRTVQEQTGIIALKFEEEKAQATKLFQKLETSVHNYHDRLFGVEIENVNTVSTSHT